MCIRDSLFFASNYFDQMYEAAVKLIKKGKAYVSDLSAEQIREYRGSLTEPGKEAVSYTHLDVYKRQDQGTGCLTGTG